MVYLQSLLSGTVRRVCLGNGMWGPVDTNDCSREDILQLSMEVIH